MTKLQSMKCRIACLFVATCVRAQSTAVRPATDAADLIQKAPASSTLLRDLDSSLEKVVAKVSPAVVQIVVTGYGPLEDHGHTDTSRIARPPPAGASPLELQPIHAEQILDARVLGTHKQSDLALLKVQASHLPTVLLRTDVRVRQGELVFAIGSPEGLRDSVTMGVVSSVARQTNPDDPMIYLQTDAAINPGNSGGPLVD